jgi:ABC-type branched-subunit amino acid transport system permease subunit
VLCVSAFLAGTAGALFAGANTSVSSNGFNSLLSLQLIPVLYLAGNSQVLAPFIAAFAFAVLPSFFSGDTFIQIQPILFGVAAVTVAALSGKQDSGDTLRRLAVEGTERARRTVMRERALRDSGARARMASEV